MLKWFSSLAIVFCFALPAEASADELQNRVLQAIRASRPDGYVFQRTVAFERTGASRKVVVERYDPRRHAPDRWSLVSVDGKPPTTKEAEQSRKAKHGPVPSYANLAEWFGSPAVRSDTTPGYAIYRFNRLPAGVMKIGSHDASADTQAEAFVNLRGKGPFVERVRFTSLKAFRMMMVASVQSIDTGLRYAPLADGSIVPTSSAITLKGSMLGKSGQLNTIITFDGFRPVS